MKDGNETNNLVLKQIGRNIRMYRENTDITLAEAAKKLGISERTIGAYERAEHEMTLKAAVDMAVLYKTTLSKLLGYAPVGTGTNIAMDIKALNYKSLRKMMGYTQIEFASEIGISKGTMSKYENHPENTLITSFYALCKRFNLSTDIMNDIARGILLKQNRKE